jgi:hypothetical protein
MRLITQITAAHICYLIAEANFESYSDTARLCLIGADHWKHPRTYANPEAIQVLCYFVQPLRAITYDLFMVAYYGMVASNANEQLVMHF